MRIAESIAVNVRKNAKLVHVVIPICNTYLVVLKFVGSSIW